jgi:hypothetical protein
MPLAAALVEALSIAAAPANFIQELLGFISHLVLFLLIGAQAKLRLPVHLAVPVGMDRRCEKGPG